MRNWLDANSGHSVVSETPIVLFNILTLCGHTIVTRRWCARTWSGSIFGCHCIEFFPGFGLLGRVYCALRYYFKSVCIFVICSASISSSGVSIKCIYVGSNVFGKCYGINFFHNILYMLLRVTSVRNLWYMIIF